MSNMVEDQAPGLEMNGGVATLTLRRPSKHNRIMPGDSEVISQYLAQLKSEPEVRVLVIRGTGCKTFSSGYTLGAIQEQLDSRFEDMLDAV